ncbi:MAG: SUMF1/EgtB/PvdO family nonheme iron enzyme [Planctomycetes bacterium]|nr:SUMF1/EgtB/PvdO family nonheme iron enzyme [Planctomycetota bacterium]
MSEHFDPYFKWLAIPPEEQPPNHYRLLGVPLFMSDADVISHAADQRMAHMRSFQTGQQGAASQRLLTEISVARACLLDLEKKAEYDTELRRQVAIQKSASARAPKKIPARPASTAVAPPAAEEPEWPIADVDSPTPKKTGTVKRTGTFKPKRRKFNSAYVALPILAMVIGVGLVAYWLQRETVAPAISKNPPSKGTVPVAPASVANVQPKPVKDAVPPPPVVEKRPRDDAPTNPITDPNPSLPGSLPATSAAVAAKDPPTNVAAPAPPADDAFPTGDEPATTEGASESSTKAPVKVPVPDEAARAKALADVKSILTDDYAKLEKLELARKLLEYAQTSPPGTARTYVLFQEGGKAAVAAGDGALIFEMVDALASQFDNVQASEAKAKALQSAAKVASKQHAAELATFILEFTQTLQNEEKYEAAHDLGESALALGRKSGDNEILREATTRRKEIIALRKDYEHAAESMAQLKAHPSDPQANEVVGKYYALSKGKWAKGLPMLAAGNDAALKEAATLDLAEPKDADKQVAVGDAWWALSAKATNASKAQLQARAVHWYQQALPQVEDALSKIKIQKRLDEAGPQEKAEPQEKVATHEKEAPQEKQEKAATPAIAGAGKSGSVKTNSIGMKLVLVAPGEFIMGSPPGEPERTAEEVQHRVKISKPFYIGMFEVTQAEYLRVMGNNPSKHVTGSGNLVDKDTRRFPVEQITWHDAMSFCQRLGEKEKKKYRLPTEAEWEYACRAGTTSAFSFGNSASSAQGNFNGHVPYGGAPKLELLGRATFVGAYAPNRLGLHDMHGNVFEWCWDSYAPDSYARSPAVDPVGPQGAGPERVIRGGCWGDPGNLCRSASRNQRNGTQSFDHVGFRVVCER